MSIKKTLLLFLVLLSFSIVFYNCSEDDPASPESEDLQYVGNWEGTSSQSDSLFQMDINTVGSKVMVTLISLHMEEGGSGSSYMVSSSVGLAEVRNGEFTYSDESLNLSGTFSSSSSVSGNYIYNDGFGGTYEGTYTAHK